MNTLVIDKPRGKHKASQVVIYANLKLHREMDTIRNVYANSLDMEVSHSIIVRRAVEGLAKRLEALTDPNTGALRNESTANLELLALLKLKR